jgi:hypothetical protein
MSGRSHGVTANGRSNGPPEYAIWKMMRQRCNNPRARKFPDYGGRGIRVCQRWDSFEAFLSDMGERPGAGYSIERKNKHAKRLGLTMSFEARPVRYVDGSTWEEGAQ